MKLFFYYSFCSFKNQIKKLFKTWVIIFILACMVIGGIIGVTVASFEDALNGDEIIDEEVIDEEIIDEEIDDLPEWITAAGIAELIASAVLIVVFFLNFILADKNGSSIFLPADVSILFASPLKPQSVLMFRLACGMGASIFASLYMLFQLPNLILNAGLRVIEALSLILIWFFLLVFSKLLNVLVYTFTSTHTKLKSYIRPVSYAFLALLAGGFYLYKINSGESILNCLFGFFNSKASRYIPVYGWMKLLLVSVFESDALGAVISLLLLISAAVVLIFLIWKIKADFYEDAMKKSEETAELLNAAQSTGFAVRKKDRSEKIKRNGELSGSGANVFFYVSLYNRARFAKFKFLTKTNITYLAAAALISFASIKLLKISSALPAVFCLGGLAFFRSLGNPIQRDISNVNFLLCPESIYKKTFYSHLAGTVNCALDLLPAVVLSQIVFKESVFFSLLSIIFIVSIDLYSGCVGTFIDTVTPSGSAKTIKALLQIMFIYFGLIPIIVIVALGFVFKLVTLFIILASVFALSCAGIFFFFTGMILQRGKN